VRPDKIRILNPTQHGSCWRGRNRAERYVRTGRAVFVGMTAIRFVESDPRNIAATKKAADAAAGYDDIRRILTVEELAHAARAEGGAWTRNSLQTLSIAVRGGLIRTTVSAKRGHA
jgi:hypothetical protein